MVSHSVGSDVFLAAVTADPWDEAPRLRHADELEGRGGTDALRAELIRLQIEERHNLRSKSYDRALVERSRELLRAHPEWAEPIGAMVDKHDFRSGYVEHVELSGRRFVENAATLFSLAPLTSLRLTNDIHEVTAEVFALPQLDQIIALEIRDTRFGDEGLAHLLASPHVTNLRWLDLWGTAISARGVDAFARASVIGGPLSDLLMVNLPLSVSPIEFEDWYDDQPWVHLPELGEELERKYGRIPWFHIPFHAQPKLPASLVPTRMKRPPT